MGCLAKPSVAGAVVLVRERNRTLRVFSGGLLIATLTKCSQSQEIVYHPDQFRTVAPASAMRVAVKPLGHQIIPPEVQSRDLAKYDQLFGGTDGGDEMNDFLQAPRLSHVEAELPALYEQARLHSLTYEAFLRRVLLIEIEERKLAAQRNRLKAACLPMRKTLEAFDFSFQLSIKQQQIWE